MFDHMVQTNGSIGWNLHLRWRINDWELDILGDLTDCLDKAMLGSAEEEDVRLWTLDSKGSYMVESYYSSKAPHDHGPFPSNIIWDSALPSKAGFLLWLVYWGRTLTMDNLMKHMANRCNMCLVDVESVCHLFLHCESAGLIWNFFMRGFRRPWVMPISMRLQLDIWNRERLDDL